MYVVACSNVPVVACKLLVGYYRLLHITTQATYYTLLTGYHKLLQAGYSNYTLLQVITSYLQLQATTCYNMLYRLLPITTGYYYYRLLKVTASYYCMLLLYWLNTVLAHCGYSGMGKKKLTPSGECLK